MAFRVLNIPAKLVLSGAKAAGRRSLETKQRTRTVGGILPELKQKIRM